MVIRPSSLIQVKHDSQPITEIEKEEQRHVLYAHVIVTPLKSTLSEGEQ